MENFQNLVKQIQETTKLLLIKFDGYEIHSDELRIDHIEIACDRNYYNTIKSEIADKSVLVEETENTTILLLNDGIEIVKNQVVEKLAFQIDDTEKFAISEIVLLVDKITDFYLRLQKKGLPVTKIEKSENIISFSLKKEITNIVFTNYPIAQKEELIALKAKLAQEIDSKLRVMADFQNYKKRLAQIQKESSDMANQNLLSSVIDVIDDCNRAVNAESNDGLNLLLDKLKTILNEQGLEQIKIMNGDKFDPVYMEALSSVPAQNGQEANTVVHVDQLGYKYINSDKLFRPAKVIVSK